MVALEVLVKHQVEEGELVLGKSGVPFVLSLAMPSEAALQRDRVLSLAVSSYHSIDHSLHFPQ